MPNLVHVVVDDPTHKLAPGYVIPNDRERSVVELRGVTVLPVDDDLVPVNSNSALDGFFIAHWGKGWIANKGAGERCCPMVLGVHPQRNYLHWVARLSPIPGMQATGRIRLAADSSQVGFLNAGLGHVNTPDLIENVPMDGTGWTIRGSSLVNVIDRGLIALSLHAVARNVRILWSAVSLNSHGKDR